MSESSTTGGGEVLVLGGGVAGLAAALRLAEAGVRVHLVEARRRLGGRATSFEDQQTGEEIDNCQHVVLRCCTHLLDFYERLGVADQITWHNAFTFIDHAGHRDGFAGDDLPAPLHLTSAFLRMKGLSLRDKVSIARAFHAMLYLPRRKRAALHNTSFEDWLNRYHPTPTARRKFWDPVIISACNETLDRTAADYALQVFQDGFLCNAEAYEMGVSDVPLARLYDPAQRAIEAAGGRITFGARVTELHMDGPRLTSAALSNGHVAQADAVISALPFEALDRLATPEMKQRDARLNSLDQIGFSPIIGVHLFYEYNGSLPMNLPHCVLTEAPVQWVFNKGVDADTGRQHLHGVISAAHDLVNQPGAQIAATADEELQRWVFDGRDATLVQHRVVKEKRATFSVQPGVDAHRPRPCPPEGGVADFYVCGDWCDTGWPATMEGACRSGYRAADAVLGRGDSGYAVLPELPDAPLFRVMNGLF